MTIALAILVAIGFSISAEAVSEENSAKPESTVPWEYPLNTTSNLLTKSSSGPVIADISKWQGDIDWTKASKALDLIIIRTQDGIKTEDFMHKNYETNANKYKVPYGVYSFVRAGTPSEARTEARAFYSRAGKNTQFYVLDVEVKTNKKGYTMRQVIDAYEDEMRKLTKKKVGLYVANHLYTSFNLKTSDFDFVWIPRYGKQAPSYKHQLWQYTSRGSVPGIKGNVDLNYLASGTSLEFFTNKIGQVSNATLATKYYVTNPKTVVLKKKANIYSKKDFDKKYTKSSYKAGTVVKIKKVTKSSAGVPHLELTNGKFITASKTYVLKTSAASLTDYYSATDNIKQIMTLKDMKTYSTSSYTSSTKGEFIPEYTILNVSRITYSGSGELRFQILNGRFVSANKADVIKVPDTIENYYREAVENLQTVKTVNVYNDVLFGEESSTESLPIGTVIEIDSIVYNKLGFPRFKLAGGGKRYISAKKTLFEQIPWYES